MSDHKILDLPKCERPFEKLMLHGAEHLSNAELLSLVLRQGIKSQNIIDISYRLLYKFEGLSGIFNSSMEELTKIAGIGKIKAAQIIAINEIMKRCNSFKPEEKIPLVNPQNVMQCLKNDLESKTQEEIFILVLNVKKYLKKMILISKGDYNSAILNPKLVFEHAFRNGGDSLILVHNHPSGDPTPSEDDVLITKKLIECSKILEVKLLDHIIIGKMGYFSLSEKKLCEF
ncbi:MAG: DNA repair protein RadC [Oscillospiraceae bacterium]|nr:DNA repair protein RadC [Oscillospiraceae bacterium]